MVVTIKKKLNFFLTCIQMFQENFVVDPGSVIQVDVTLVTASAWSGTV